MKNKTVKMLLAAAVLAVCCGAYAGVKSYVSSQEQKEAEAEEDEESVTVFSASSDDIQSLGFLVDDTETTFEKNGDTWLKKDETDFPVNQTTLDSAAAAIASVDAERVLEDVEDLAEYGLEESSNEICIVSQTETDTEENDSEEESADAVTTVFYVGDENQSTGQYYIRKDDDEKTVYLVDSSCVEPFAKSLYDYAQMEDFPAISATDMISRIVVEGNEDYTLSKNEDTGLWSVKSGEDEEKADSATASSLVSSFGSMAYDSLVDYKCEDKSQYGLDEPYALITVEYQEEVEVETEEDADANTLEEDTSSEDALDETTETVIESEDTDTTESDEEMETEMEDRQLVIAVGDEADSSNRYVIVNDSQQVYTMSNDTLDKLIEKTEEDFWDMTVSYVSLNNLASLKVNYQGSDHKVNVSRETSEDDEGNETETVTYKLDGQETETTDLTTFYNKLINITAQKRLTEVFEPEGETEMSVIFTEEDGDTLKVEYYSYDTNYYAAVVDGKVYLVNKMNVKDLFTAFDTLIGSENTTADELTDADTAVSEDEESDSKEFSEESDKTETE